MTKTEALWLLCNAVAQSLNSLANVELTPQEKEQRKRLLKAHRKITPWATERMKMLMEKRADKARVWRKEPPDQVGLWRIRGEGFGPMTVEIDTVVFNKTGPVTMEVGERVTVIRNPEWSWIGPAPQASNVQP